MRARFYKCLQFFSSVKEYSLHSTLMVQLLLQEQDTKYMSSLPFWNGTGETWRWGHRRLLPTRPPILTSRLLPRPPSLPLWQPNPIRCPNDICCLESRRQRVRRTSILTPDERVGPGLVVDCASVAPSGALLLEEGFSSVPHFSKPKSLRVVSFFIHSVCQPVRPPTYRATFARSEIG